MNIFRKIKHLFVLLLIPATLALFFNNQTNKHIHILPNGEIITHSHPFSKDAGNKHNHTSKEFSLISHLNHVTTDAFLIILIIPVLIRIFKTERILQEENNLSSIVLLKSGRAPPLS